MGIEERPCHDENHLMHGNVESVSCAPETIEHCVLANWK